MNFLLTIMTCDKRNQVLEQTLTSLRASDWGEEPLVYTDTTRHPDPKISQTKTSLQILQDAERRDWDYLLFCEDDIIFNKHLRHNLENWSPVKYGMCLVGSLYQGDLGGKVHGGDYWLADAGVIGGSQCVVIKRQWLGEIIRLWDSLNVGMQDMRLYQGASRYFPYVYISHPNLVQHQSVPSTWAGPPHTSKTFDLEYRS